MNEYIDMLFGAMANKGDFQNLDEVITREADERLKHYHETLSASDYETVRDAVFSVSAIAREQAFETGFKTAINLILECRGL